ncbi:methionyl-tRNA formyltransferase [Candidatus Woesearchaeota archaeon]|nr:methionyl-tRNA formyltransferase [Candidatus Woesearchaeota archaeon]
MKIIILGTTEFTLNCAKAAMDSGAEPVLISLPEKSRPVNSADTAGFAEQHKIPYYEIEDINSAESVSLLKKLKPDCILSSWPMIIGKEALAIPKMCIGSHPTALPHNRGRHPLHWLIAMGIRESKLSFFRMDEGIDSGSILLQKPFAIEEHETIADAVEKVNAIAYEAAKQLCEQLSTIQAAPQDSSKANYWRKRTPHDTVIDLRMTADAIKRTVRSYTKPYPCAKLIFEDYAISIISAKTAEASPESKRMEPGKIISIKGNKITAKADDAIIELEAEKIPEKLLKAKYIYPPTKYASKWSSEQAKEFEG